MSNRSLLISLVWLATSITTPLLAQRSGEYAGLRSHSHSGIRAGIIHSETVLMERTSLFYPRGIPPIGGIHARQGFYAGSFYQKEWFNFLIGRFDINYQMKGLIAKEPSGKLVLNSKYHYLGVNPQIGVKPFNWLALSCGPEVNFLLSAKSPYGKTVPAEVGAAARLALSAGRAGLEIGYFRGFTEYEFISIVRPVYFYNYNWQAGLTYRLTNK